MTKRYEYLVCQAQNGRVTFVNGQWRGTQSLGGADSEQALQSCPEVWTYLAQEGQNGWELVAVIDHVDAQGAYERLYLKRASPGPPPGPPPDRTTGTPPGRTTGAPPGRSSGPPPAPRRRPSRS